MILAQTLNGQTFLTADFNEQTDLERIKQAFVDGFAPLTDTPVVTAELGQYEKLEYQYEQTTPRTAPTDNSDVDTDEEKQAFAEGKLSLTRLSLLRREKLMAMTIEELTARAGTTTRTATAVTDNEQIDSTIEDLRDQLANSNNEMTFCYEASILGEEPPYDVKEIAKKRRALREQIKELENKKVPTLHNADTVITI